MSRIVLLSAVLLAPAADFQSITARNARVRHKKELLRARLEFLEEAGDSAKRYVRQLKSALTSETKAGNLQEANKLKAEIDRVVQLLPADIARAADAASAPSGRWMVKYQNHPAPRVYSFNEMTVVISGEDGETTGRLRFASGSWWLDMGDNDTNRVNVVGDRIFIEHWRGRKGDAKFSHSIASGYRVK